MLFDFAAEPSRFRFQEKNMSWKDIFRQSVYAKNQKMICSFKKSFSRKKQKAKKQICSNIFKSFFTHQHKNRIVVNDCDLPKYPHGYYCLYVSIKNSTRFDDEISCYFPYFKQLVYRHDAKTKELGYEEISILMNKSKDSSNPDVQKIKSWKIIIEKFTCKIDVIKKIQIFIETLKVGNITPIQSYQRQLNPKCQLKLFMMQIFRASGYFVKPKKINQNFKSFSLQVGEKLNEVSMSQTYKMLFCVVCFKYDCGRHAGEDKDFQHRHNYYSYKNKLKQKQIVDSAIDLYHSYSQMLWELPDEQQKSLCQFCCYNQMDKKRYFYLKNHPQRVLSTTIKNIVSMGIKLFGYNPCKIVKLLSNENYQYTCESVFLYIIEELLLLHIILNRLQPTHSQLLKNINRENFCNIILPLKEKERKKRLMVGQTYFDIGQISVCHHYFFGDQPQDLSCFSCCCKNRGFCRKQCLCSDDCPLKKGCNCRSGECKANKCICYKNSRQCEPGLCTNCFNYNNNIQINSCKNNEIMLRKFSLLRIGKSGCADLKTVSAGLGLFAQRNIEKKQLVSIYTGQIINSQIETLRASLSKTQEFYNFMSKGVIIDSCFLGNKTRFMNHGNDGEDNVISENKLCNGDYVIAFYANRDIKAGEQLLFNYDGNGKIYKEHRQKYPFIKRK